MATKPMTLELVPVETSPMAEDGNGDAAKGAPAAPVPPPAPAAAPAAAEPSIEFVAPGAAPIDLDATQPIHADRFLREATLQYQEGHVDAPLWDRALAQANGDKERAAALYIERRAIALRMLERERRARPHGGESHAARPPGAAAGLPASGDVDDWRHPPAESPLIRFRIPIIAAGGLVPLLVAGWFVIGHYASRSAEPATPAVPAPATARGKAPAAAKPAAPAAPAAAPAAPATGRASAALMQKIDELREAKNWNLLVLYLVEWTRQEPRSVDAWNQLRAGYVTLRQYEDALTAAKKAAELKPDDATMRARIGDVHAYRDDPAAALAAYEEAASRDPADADSRIRIGLLHAQLGRSVEAKSALDGALAIVPGDPLALCVRTGIAQMTTAPGDTYGRGREARSIDAKCRGQ